MDSRHLEIYEKPKIREYKWSEPLKNQFIASLFRYDLSAVHLKIFIFFKIVPFENYLLEQCILGTKLSRKQIFLRIDVINCVGIPPPSSYHNLGSHLLGAINN